MSFDCTPSVIIGAFFATIVFMDLFRHDYKNAPIHALEGLFFTILLSMLCKQRQYLLAWACVLVPFIWIAGGIFARDLKAHRGLPSNITVVERAYNGRNTP